MQTHAMWETECKQCMLSSYNVLLDMDWLASIHTLPHIVSQKTPYDSGKTWSHSRHGVDKARCTSHW